MLRPLWWRLWTMPNQVVCPQRGISSNDCMYTMRGGSGQYIKPPILPQYPNSPCTWLLLTALFIQFLRHGSDVFWLPAATEVRGTLVSYT
jgi:hypothetical protein